MEYTSEVTWGELAPSPVELWGRSKLERFKHVGCAGTYLASKLLKSLPDNVVKVTGARASLCQSRPQPGVQAVSPTFAAAF